MTTIKQHTLGHRKSSINWNVLALRQKSMNSMLLVPKRRSHKHTRLTHRPTGWYKMGSWCFVGCGFCRTTEWGERCVKQYILRTTYGSTHRHTYTSFQYSNISYAIQLLTIWLLLIEFSDKQCYAAHESSLVCCDESFCVEHKIGNLSFPFCYRSTCSQFCRQMLQPMFICN